MNHATAERAAGVGRMAIAALAVNTALALVKLAAGLVGHSYALVADAVESLTDVVASAIVWRGAHVAAMPADEDHPYGHGKAEAVAALIVALMLIGAAVGIAVEAVREILTPHGVPAAFTLWVLLGVVVVKEVLYRLARHVASRFQSAAVLADAWHHRSDALTSLAAAIGISVALAGGPAFAPADDWAALFAATVILFNAGRILVAPVNELMDRRPTELIAQVRAVAARVPGVAAIEKVHARKSGARFWVDMHVQVDPEMSVRDAHALAHAVKDGVRGQLPAVEDVLVHIEPHRR